MFTRLSYSKKYLKVIPVDLSKQQKLNPDPKSIQQISFTANLEQDGNTQITCITEETKETTLDFSKGTLRVFC